MQFLPLSLTDSPDQHGETMATATRPSATLPQSRGKARNLKRNPGIYGRKPCLACGKLTSNGRQVCGRCLTIGGGR